MRGRELEKYLAGVTRLTESDLEVRFGELRKLRMLPSGGRGLSAPNLTREHVATALIGLAAGKAIEAARAVMDFAALPEVDDAGNREDYGETFAEALTAAIESEPKAALIADVVIDKTVISATINYEDGGVRRFSSDRTKDLRKTYLLSDRIVISGRLLLLLANELDNEDAPSGWTALSEWRA